MMSEHFSDFDHLTTRKRIVDFIGDQLAAAGFERAILGLSGGLDSALVAYLALEALGAHRLTCVAMPYRTSAPDSLGHARLLAAATGIELLEVDISPMVDIFFENRPDADIIRRGNRMARERMCILYDISAAMGGLVLGTGNKSELYLGYGTLYGDLACAIEPLGDIYKSEVRLLAREMGVPREIIDKPPSADLWVGQSDEQELGFSYEEVDPVLELLVDRGLEIQAIIGRGFDPPLVEEVAAIVARTEFKRKMPPCCVMPAGWRGPGPTIGGGS
jgi:NAD+ synthase